MTLHFVVVSSLGGTEVLLVSIVLPVMVMAILCVLAEYISPEVVASTADLCKVVELTAAPPEEGAIPDPSACSAMVKKSIFKLSACHLMTAECSRGGD